MGKISFFALLCAMLSSCVNTETSVSTNNENVNETGVLICIGRYSKRYYNSEKCKGLKRCSGEIKYSLYKKLNK